MAERTVFAHAAKTSRERLGENQLAEQLGGVLRDLRDRRILVAAIKEAQEVAAILTVDRTQPWRLRQRAQDVSNALGRVEAASGEERVALDHVACDQRVLEVEGG